MAIDGFWGRTVEIVLESITGGRPAGGVPVAVAVLSIAPESRSACVTT